MDIFPPIIPVTLTQDLIAKIILIIVLLLYTLFALILASQIRSLSKVIDQINFSPVFILFGYLHAVLAILILLGVLIIL